MSAGSPACPADYGSERIVALCRKASNVALVEEQLSTVGVLRPGTVASRSRHQGSRPPIGTGGPPRRRDDGRLGTVEIATDEDAGGWAHLEGGPCDGRLDPLDGDTVELQVHMEDGQQHVYRRTILRRDVNGRSAVVFEWVGRTEDLR